jgi:hypothetical protein
MFTGHSKDHSTTSSRTDTVSSISGPEYAPRHHSTGSGDKRFSLDGFDEKVGVEDPKDMVDDSPGTLPDSVYDAQMSWWRAAVRRMLIRSLKHESRFLGYIQVCYCLTLMKLTLIVHVRAR